MKRDLAVCWRRARELDAAILAYLDTVPIAPFGAICEAVEAFDGRHVRRVDASLTRLLRASRVVFVERDGTRAYWRVRVGWAA